MTPSLDRIIILEDEEIALVVPEMSDLEIMTRGINHLENNRFIDINMPKGVMGHKAEEEYLLGLISKPHQHHFVIILKSDPLAPAIGNLGLHQVSEFNRNAKLGILLYGDYPGRGIGSRAIKLLLRYGFEYLSLHKISLQVSSLNERAIACYAACGFSECSREREHIWSGDSYADRVGMEILRSEW